MDCPTERDGRCQWNVTQSWSKSQRQQSCSGSHRLLFASGSDGEAFKQQKSMIVGSSRLKLSKPCRWNVTQDVLRDVTLKGTGDRTRDVPRHVTRDVPRKW